MTKELKLIKIRIKIKLIMDKIEIIIARDFSKTTGARYIKDGDFSGEEFYEKLLLPKFKQAKKRNEKVFIDFDNTWPYASSFISEAFGRLSDRFGKDIMKNLEIKSDEDGSLKYEIEQAIKEGNN